MRRALGLTTRLRRFSRGVPQRAQYQQQFSSPSAAAKQVNITFVEPDGTRTPVDADIGENFLNVAHSNDIELEGACGGELACSTCHLIFDEQTFDSLPEMEEEEVRG